MGENKVSIMDLLLFLLQNPTLHSQATMSAHDNTCLILQLLLREQGTEGMMADWAVSAVKDVCTREIVQLANRKAGFHFLVQKTQYKQLKDTEIHNMADKMERAAPMVWNLVDVLLSADPKRVYQCEWTQKKAKRQWENNTTMSSSREVEGDSDEEDYFQYFNEIPLMNENEDEPEDLKQQAVECHNTILEIVSCRSANGWTTLTIK